MTAKEIIEKYISFFEKRGHKRIPNAPLIPENDPTTLFISSGMQPLIPYLLGEEHPMGKRLVNVQNCFRSQDIDEVGDNRHTTFFRMLGNWSLGDYFKKEEIPWLWELLTKEFGLPKEKLYITVFDGDNDNGIIFDSEACDIWLDVLEKSFGTSQKHRIFSGSVDKNWWSRSGAPNKMPLGEIGGPDTEVYYRFDELKHNENCKGDSPVLCECGAYLEIANSVFMQYLKSEDGFVELPQKNIDYGGGLERLLAAIENQNDIFQTSLFFPIAKSIEDLIKKDYKSNARAIRIITDHLIASVFMVANGIIPSNKEQGYVLRRLLRRSIRYGKQLGINESFTSNIAHAIISNYSNTDPYLVEKEKNIKDLFDEEEKKFSQVIHEGLRRSKNIFQTKVPIKSDVYSKIMQIPDKKELFRDVYKNGDLKEILLTPEEIKNATITGDESFNLYQSFGFPIEMIVELAQEECLLVDIEAFRKNLEDHQKNSRIGGAKKFTGGLADHSEQTVRGHTATHLLHKALRDMFGAQLHQTGSNITSERVRFDFNFDRNLTPDEIKKIEDVINEKIKENLPVRFEMLPLAKAKETDAVGLFDEKYGQTVKVYFIGPSAGSGQEAYSVEFCGGPHVAFTSEIKSFKIIKQENIGKGNRRLYAKVG